MKKTAREMQMDLMDRYYENTLKLMNGRSEEEKQRILHEAINTFTFACERIPCND